MMTLRKPLLLVAACSALLFGSPSRAGDGPFDLLPSSPAKLAIAPPVFGEIAEPEIVPVLRIHDDRLRLQPIDLTIQPNDLWERIRNGFAMPDLSNDQVNDRMAHFLDRPEYIARIVERSRRYLYFIVDELEKRGMPTELALLPMVESAFNPMALSSARASGLWQFVPATGKSYNLSQNWWYDQRRDVVASTTAALDYLQTIYEMHGDWHLALASYNWGEGAVARAIERNRQLGEPTDYQHLNMPAETRYYVPKLQALKNIIAQPQRFGIDLPSIPNRPYFATVKKPAGIDVALAAKLAETPMDEFVALNPSYKRPVMPGGSAQPMIVPAEKVDAFHENLRNHDEPLSNWVTRRLQKGETVDALAARLGMSGTKLREVNGIPPGWRVPVGHALLVPAAGAASLEIDAEDLPASSALSAPSASEGRATARHVKANGKRRAAAVARPSSKTSAAKSRHRSGSRVAARSAPRQSPTKVAAGR
ncbi:MAG: transglycosylase SLT domain-containing protein [Sterolibacteriaceae bacterium]|uniref:Transglycosylase SLT domain-containing protein n=1 Tax=Candidatus Methylophosphatis roskildensis TaxID=2899263 RepID=A0A9D7E3X2_9PROT|nr:transglycosylase SLT domain-containing protein [Candidatus Methylophosphatis roskildensis]